MIGSVKSVYLYIGWAIAIGIGCPSPLSAQRSLWQKLGDQGVWGVQTNALYDALLIPNIGVTYGFDKDWSVHLNWMYSWWKNDHQHRYWRTYGGMLEVRRWFGACSDASPLTGHHVGLYGQLLTYDFEWGGRGYL